MNVSSSPKQQLYKIFTFRKDGRILLKCATTETKDKVEGRFLLNVVIRKSSSIFQLFSREDQPLLLRRNSFLILDFCLDILNCVVRLNVESDRLSSQGFHEDLHCTTAKSKNKVKSRFFLDVIIRKSSSVFKLLSGEDETLLLWRDAFFVLDLGFDILDGVIWLNVQGDGLSSERLHEDLHSTTAKSKNKVKGRFLLDVVVRKGSSIFKLFTSENESLLLWRNTFLVLDLCFYVL